MYNFFGKIWNWLGDQKNHNALVAILMIVVPISVLFLGIYFENRMRIIESNIEELFGRQITETFTYEDIKRFNPAISKMEDEKIDHIEIVLKHKPVLNSVTLWLGGIIQNPTEYTLNNKTINIKLTPPIEVEYFESIQEYLDKISVVVYTKTSFSE